MGSSSSAPKVPEEHVLVLGGTGRTGRRLVARLLEDGDVEVTAVVRDTDKAQLVFGEALDGRLNVVEGDLADVDAWAHRLDGVSQVVTAVSCGMSTDPLVMLGVRSPLPGPAEIDGAGIANLAAAAKSRGVRRVVAVTTASAGDPWSPAAVFLNTIHSMSVKWKWSGEQAIRRSGLDYVILRPYGLGRDEAPPPGERGIDWTQSTGHAIYTSASAETMPPASKRRIPRDDVAKLCHEALRLPADDGPPARVTLECWATSQHSRPLEWPALTPDDLRAEYGGALPEVDHDFAVAATLGGVALVGGGLARGAWRGGRTLLRRLAR
jgi:uncharacterized protein YbjT (DUF2867 family)